MYQAYGSLHVSAIILELNLGAKLFVYPKLCRLSGFIGVKKKKKTDKGLGTLET